MEAKYYVTVRPRTNDTHSIHKEGCPFLADDEKRIYLGMFKSASDAIKEGRQYYHNSGRCPFCSKETETVKDDSIRYTKIDTDRISDRLQLPVFLHSNMFCCVN
jgi:hypothetical protein